MIINNDNLALVFSGFKTAFNEALEGAPKQYKKLAMIVPSMARDETYGWLGKFPGMREWQGSRVINNLTAHTYTIKNRDFEMTIEVERKDIEDDQYGIFKPIVSEMGLTVASHPDDLVFSLLANGFSTACYDGKFFFDEQHPVTLHDVGQTVSNFQPGAGTPWFLIDASRAVKPIVFQERSPYEFETINNNNDEHVFLRNKYLYGVRARVNAGFALWQLAYASKGELNKANYEAARTAMTSQRANDGRPLGISPTILVVPPSLEGAARRLLKTTVNGGESNEWADSAELLVSPYLM